ncbi:hypothetical protein RHGRI_001151 [Rhododendron griersonianum]|uniref:Uncharacterized protein n=1 Tax=Rhododendron griersonianum TaxID=479676 RepID=A0AAV6LK16_9ERIC|nr:hypothetical protein RHGRI_001151 [Rhododendron griersonianum]
MMSSESIPSAMPSPSPKRRRNEDDQIDFGRVTGEEEELWSGYSENEEECLLRVSYSGVVGGADDVDLETEGHKTLGCC